MSKSNFASYSSPEELASSFNTDLNTGLGQIECDSRLAQYGENEFKSQQTTSKVISKYLEQFKNPLLQLLLVSVVLSVFMGQYDDAISITLAIVIVVTVAFIQEYRSERSIQELSKLVPPNCKAIRDGYCQEFLAKLLVPGDIVVISTGDRVPADIRLIECHDLGIDESNLTGESELMMKSCSTRRPTFRYNSYNTGDKNNNNNNNNNQELVQRQDHYNNSKTSKSYPDSGDSMSTANLAYMGTLVQSGHGKGIVIGTGDNTQFGIVFKMMETEESPKSPLQQNMDELGKHLSLYSLVIITIIVIIGLIQSRPLVEMFTIGVSLAVAAIPEGLPIVVTVTLAFGVMRMAEKKAVVKKLSAVETLGCVKILCSDKTGTLTKNEMTVSQTITSESYSARFTGVGYTESGEMILQDINQDQDKQTNSIKDLFTAACLCTNAHFDTCNGIVGQTTEAALLVAGNKLGLQDPRNEYTRLDEIPFSSKYKYMVVKCVHNNETNGQSTFYVKGALDVLLEKCKTRSQNGRPVKLLNTDIESIKSESESLEILGLRVLAIASGNDLQNLTYLGVIGIHDAPRTGVSETIETLRSAGVDVKMITGDSKYTALSIAKQVGIASMGVVSISGQEINDLMTNPSLSELQKADRLSKFSVFYRVSPSHKVTIVKMLQLLGNVIAMTGDGVNDSVALKKSDIGVAMGLTGTDVCKEAAAVILMDDNLSTLNVALEEGRAIFHNIRNFIRFQLSTSIAALSLIATSTIFHIPTPFNAMQILYINIIMDGPPAQCLGLESVSQYVRLQPPRNVKEPVLTRSLLVNVIMSASIIFIGTMIVFISEMSDGVVTPRDTTMTFTCFVFFDLFNAISCRSQNKLIFEIGFFTNRSLMYSILGSFAAQLLLIYCRPFQMIFQTESISLIDLLSLLAISSSVFIISEGFKLFQNRAFKRRLYYKTPMYLV